MIRSGVGSRLALLAFLVLAPLAKADTPPATPPTLAKVETMVTNLGYSVTEANDKQSFWIAWSGKYDYHIHFYLSQDALLIYTYVQLLTLSADDLKKLDYVKMFEANDSGDFFFSMESGDDGERLYANGIIPVANLSPGYLRSSLQDWTSKIDDSDSMWSSYLK